MRTIRRVTIERDGVYFSHGVNRCYLKIRATLPTSLETAVIGLPLRHLVAVPGLDAECIQPWRRGRSIGKGWTEYDIVRCFSMLSTQPQIGKDT